MLKTLFCLSSDSTSQWMLLPTPHPHPSEPKSPILSLSLDFCHLRVFHKVQNISGAFTPALCHVLGTNSAAGFVS